MRALEQRPRLLIALLPSEQEAEIIATGLAPASDLESAIIAVLPPANYTAIVRGVDDTTGVGLVEVYALN